jgi:hypothetical protein
MVREYNVTKERRTIFKGGLIDKSTEIRISLDFSAVFFRQKRRN